MKLSLHNALPKALILAFFFFFTNIVTGQNVVVSGAVTGNGSYPDLNSAFAAINSGGQPAANIHINIIASTTETASAVLNSGSWITLSITPSGGAPRTVTGSFAGPLIDFSGADYVYIDGLESGGNALTLMSTNTNTASTSTIRFIDGAANNTIIRCNVLGSSASATLGTIYFSTSGFYGNSNNTISSCTVSAAGVNCPGNAILSLGSAIGANVGNVIQNCSISDYFSPSFITAGIQLAANNSNWTISGNKFFQSALRTYTAAVVHRAIYITSGSSHIVTNNTIGFSSASGTGTYAMTATVAARFAAIELSSTIGAAASSIQGNTITAITLTTTGTTATGTGMLCGIGAMAGNINVGNLSANFIGGSSGANLMTLQPANGGMIVGINSSSTGSIVIQNNTIGGLTASSPTGSITGDCVGINIAGVTAALNISNNSIGNSTADNMRGGTNGLTTVAPGVSGISLVPTMTGLVSISNNTVQNLAAYGGTATATFVRGIWTTPTSGAGTYSITSNVILNLVTNSALTTITDGKAGALGIGTSAGVNNVIAGNTISNISSINTATTAGYAVGISLANATDPSVYNNRIYNITNARTATVVTGPGVVAGILIRSAVSSVKVFNNMISLGNGSPANTAFIGISANHGVTPLPVNGDLIYHNTINIEGTVTTGAQPSFGFYRGDFSTTAQLGVVNFKNNIITNTRSGGTGAHYAIANHYGATTPTNTGWVAGASNNNVLNANAATIGWWTTAQTFAGWKTTSAGDVNSYSGTTVTYVNSANDLHLNMGVTPTPIESGALLNTGITTDYDNQVRPGPVGSVNGAGLTADIGADEIDGVAVDGFAPIITYAPLLADCSTGDRTFTATITDGTGVPISGALVPTVYYKKNAGSYFSSPGILLSGNGVNGAWSFTLSASAMGGLASNDVVSYFVIAQDNSVNIGSTPSTGLVATNVNAVTTPPTIPSTYTLSALSGTYNVGSAGTYTSLTAAAFAYNNSCLAGPVTFMLTDASYSASETFPIVFLNNIYASAANSLLIRPASGISPTITGSSSLTLIGFSGADYITIDGSNNGSTTKDLMVANTNTGTLSSVLFLGNKTTTDAASNLAVNNCAIKGNSGTTTYGGIVVSSGITPGSASEISNNNMTISGNTFVRSYYGVYAIGNAATPDQNWKITGNMYGSATPADKIGYRAINVQNASQVVINSNTITGVTSTVVTNPPAGIVLALAVSNATLSYNIISDIKNTNTTAASGASGILLSTTSTVANVLVSNNMISDVAGYGGTGVAVGSNGNGMTISNGAGYKIYHNSVLLNTNQANPAATSRQAALHLTSGIDPGAIDLRNNIFSITQTIGVRYCIQSATADNSIFSNIDDNCYSTSSGTLGFLTSARVTLADLQTGFGSNLNSTTVAPVFVSASDLHLVAASNGALDDAGTAVNGVPVDIDNQARNLNTPDIGADEFTGPGCAAVNAGSLSVTAYTLCTGQSTALATTGASSGSGITYRWRVSPTPGGPYTNVVTGSGFISANLTTTFPTAGTYYYVLTNSCSAASASAVSNEATVTVNAAPVLSISSTHTLACAGSSVILTANGASSYTWSAGGATSTIQVLPTTTTVYTFTGTILSCSTTASLSIPYSANPVITAASAPVSMGICAGTQATLAAFGAGTYTWTDGVNVISGATVNPTPSVTTIYTVVGTSTTGCKSAPITQSVNVNVVNLAVSGNTAVCPGESTTLTASGAISYTWSTGALTSTISDTPPSSTSYTLSGSNNYGCTATLAQPVSVGNVSVTISGPTNVCAGKTVTLTALGATSYTWSDGSNAQDLIFTPTANTSYSVFGISGNCSNSATKTISYNQNPTVTISGNTTICAGETATLTASGGTTYSWSTGSTATVINVSPVSNTTYTLTGTNAFACSNTSVISVASNSVPVINIAATSTAVCLTFPVTYTASGAGTYTWNGTGPNTNTFSVIPTADATYTLVGTSAQNCSTSKTVAIVTHTLPVLSLSTPSATLSLCAQTATTILAFGASTLTWNGTVVSPAFSFTATANVTHTVVGVTDDGCTATATIGIITNTIPVVTANPPTSTVCPLVPLSLTASGASTYLWDGFAPGATVSFGQLISTTHTVIGTSAQGCTASALASVTTLAAPSISITPNFTTMCYGTTASFTASGGNSYSWFDASTNSVVAITPTAAASYSVVGTGANGCSSTVTALVLTTALPAITVSPVSATVCSTSSVNLTASGATTYTWVGVGTGSAVIANPTVATVYTVNGKDAITGCVGSATISVITNTLPVITILPASPEICLDAAVTLTATGANSYSWNTNSTSPIIVTSPATTTVYVVNGKNLSGCSSSKTISVVVNPLPVIAVSPATTGTMCAGEIITFSASGAATYTWVPGNVVSPTFTNAPTATSYYSVTATDLHGCESSLPLAVIVNKCTGLNENILSGTFINIYPNPSSGTFNVEVDSRADVVVYDLLGTVVYSGKLEAGKQAVVLEDKAKGVYLVKISVNEKHQTVRLVIE